jgi:hypothetical protein
MRPGSLDDVDGLAADLAAAAGVEEQWRVAAGEGETVAHVSVFEDASGAARAVCVGNPAASPARVRLRGPSGLALRNPWTDRTVAAVDGVFRIDLDAYAVQLLAVSVLD